MKEITKMVGNFHSSDAAWAKVILDESLLDLLGDPMHATS